MQHAVMPERWSLSGKNFVIRCDPEPLQSDYPQAGYRLNVRGELRVTKEVALDFINKPPAPFDLSEFIPKVRGKGLTCEIRVDRSGGTISFVGHGTVERL